MRRRFTGLLVSIVLAVFGTVALVGYVQSAHDKAAASEVLTPVLVVEERVTRGTKAEDLDGSVGMRELPKDQVVPGAIDDLQELQGKVAATDLLPGEQLLAARFDTPKALGRAGVPEGFLEVTVRLGPERAVGGVLRPGDTVAVLSSFDPFEIDAAGLPDGADAPKKTPNTTHIILQKALVTNVQSGDGSDDDVDEDTADDRSTDPVPEGELLVTLAVEPAAVQRIVFTAEFGKLWLSAQPDAATSEQLIIETRGTVDR